MSFSVRASTVFLKDLSLELRSRDMLAGGIVFSLLVALVMSFALEPSARRAAVGGLLWVTLLLASGVTVGRSSALERENGCLDMLLTVPGDRAAIFLGKAAANAAATAVVAALVLPAFGVLFHVDLLPSAPSFALVVLLGSIAIAFPGTLLGTLVGETRAAEMLLPLLLFPLEIPPLIAAVEATRGIVSGASIADVGSWLRLLVAFDVVFAAVAAALYDRLMGR